MFILFIGFGRAPAGSYLFPPPALVAAITAEARFCGSFGTETAQKYANVRAGSPRLRTNKFRYFKDFRRGATTFGTRGSQVQILPLRPAFPRLHRLRGRYGTQTPPRKNSAVRTRNFSARMLSGRPREMCQAGSASREHPGFVNAVAAISARIQLHQLSWQFGNVDLDWTIRSGRLAQRESVPFTRERS